MKYVCDNCGHECNDSTIKHLEECPDLNERLSPGSVVPAGECPRCGCFAYVAEDTKTKTIYVEIRAGCLTGIYGDSLDTDEQIIFEPRDFDNIERGDEDPAPKGYTPDVHYW